MIKIKVVDNCYTTNDMLLWVTAKLSLCLPVCLIRAVNCGANQSSCNDQLHWVVAGEVNFLSSFLCLF